MPSLLRKRTYTYLVRQIQSRQQESSRATCGGHGGETLPAKMALSIRPYMEIRMHHHSCIYILDTACACPSGWKGRYPLHHYAARVRQVRRDLFHVLSKMRMQCKVRRVPNVFPRKRAYCILIVSCKCDNLSVYVNLILWITEYQLYGSPSERVTTIAVQRLIAAVDEAKPIWFL